MIGTIEQVAARLGTRPGTLNDWITRGCPVIRRGSRGRGKSHIVDEDVARAWRVADKHTREWLLLAQQIPEVAAEGTWRTFLRLTAGLEPADRAVIAEILATAWFETTTALLDHLRARGLDFPELEQSPTKIMQLARYFR